MNHLFIKPLDVLVLRGNKLFADAGSHGEALMPPWPSVAAGAIRSRMLADQKVNLSDFASGKARLSAEFAASLGSAAAPGDFRVSHFGLARKHDDGSIEALFPLPADVVVDEQGHATRLQPTQLDACLATSYPLPRNPVLAQASPSKPRSGLWLTAAGFSRWQAGQALDAAHWIESAELWKTDSRLGIALEPGRHTAAEGQLYTSEAVALQPDVGFLVSVAGADGLLPQSGLLRFGGDGHAAAITPCSAALKTPNFVDLAKAGRFRLLLVSPGIFPDGWKLPGTDPAGRWHFGQSSARLASAAVPRLETLSGWDLALRRPKPAVRAAPTGSVYWLDDFQGKPDDLDALLQDGLPLTDPARRAEGFNAVQIAAW